MSIISSALFNEASGSFGNIILYKVKNQMRIRVKSMVHKDKKSPKQLAQRKKLKTVLKLYQNLDHTFVCSWQQQSEALPMNCCNLFIKENIANISPEGNIISPENLKISTGPLQKPTTLKVELSTEKLMTVTWDTDDLPYLLYDDILQIGVYGYITEIEEDGIYYLREARAIRMDGKCQFEMPEGRGELHFYVCFKSLYTNEYSDSVYIGSWEV